MRHPAFHCLSIVVLLLVLSPARSEEEPQAILMRAINALGGEANLTRAKAIRAKIQGTLYDSGVKESPLQGAKFTGELITQLPTQVKLSMDIDFGGQHLLVVQVLNGNKAWTRDNENSQPDSEANRADLAQSAYVDYVS